MPFILPENRRQMIMESLEDTISSNNPVRLIDMIVDKIVNSNPKDFIRSKESDCGAPSYLSLTLLKLYVYGYLNSISSSRKLEKETYKNKEVIWLLGNLQPDHWTISNYRKEHGEQITKATKLFRKFLRSNEYMDFKTIAYDGTKIKANSKRGMLTLEKIEKDLENAEKRIAEYLEKLKVNDIIEENTEDYEANDFRNSIDMQLINKIEQLEIKIRDLQAIKLKMEEKGLKRISQTDEDTRLMKSREGKMPCYNVQTGIDSKNHMIAHCETTTDEADVQQLPIITESLEQEYAEVPKEALADKGYYNPDDIEKVESNGKTKVYVAVPKTKTQNSDISFEYDAEKNVYICSEGKELKLLSRNKKCGNSRADVYRGVECMQCPKKDKCTTSKYGRQIYRYINHEYREKFKIKMITKLAKEKMKERRSLVEHPFGTMKILMGKIPLLLRGKTKVQTEMNLYSTAYNLIRLINIENMDELLEKVMGFSWK